MSTKQSSDKDRPNRFDDLALGLEMIADLEPKKEAAGAARGGAKGAGGAGDLTPGV